MITREAAEKLLDQIDSVKVIDLMVIDKLSLTEAIEERRRQVVAMIMLVAS